VEKMKLSEFITKIQTKIHNRPFKPLTLPQKLSKRPQFYG
jgi:hypothetical protein